MQIIFFLLAGLFGTLFLIFVYYLYNEKLVDNQAEGDPNFQTNIDKLKAISYWERKMIKNILDDALTKYIDLYEKDNGPIQLPK